MFKRTLIVFFLLAASLFSVYSCNGVVINGRPPEFTIHNPLSIIDGQGNVIIAYQVNDTSKNTYLQKYDTQGKSLWQTGTSLDAFSPVFGESRFIYLLPGSQGNTAVIYMKNGEVCGVKMDVGGRLTGEKNLSITSNNFNGLFTVKDAGENGIFIAWKNIEDALFIQRYDNNLGAVWPEPFTIKGISDYDISVDGEGNAFILWKDKPSFSEGSLYVLKLDKTGRSVWTSTGSTETGNGILVDPLEVLLVGFGSPIVADNEGGIIAAHVHGELKENTHLIVRQDLYAQHIDKSGTAMWAENGISLGETASLPRIVRGEDGSILVGWTDMHTVYIQKLDKGGNPVWSKPVEAALPGVNNGAVYYNATTDGHGGAVIVWNYQKDGKSSLHAQMIDANGNLRWGNDGIRVSSSRPFWTSFQTPANITPDSEGGYIITWAAGTDIFKKAASWAQRLDSDGKLLWGTDGIRLDGK